MLGGVGWRLLLEVLFFSSVVTLFLTLTQLYLDYRDNVGEIDQRMSEIDNGYRQSLGEGLWRMDQSQLQLQVDGILRLPDISYVEVREATDQAAPLVVTAGSHRANSPTRREFQIFYAVHGAQQLLGTLAIEATYRRVYRRLVDTTAVILVSQAIKTFIVSFFILFIVHRLITRHLIAIGASLRRYELRGPLAPLRLERRPPQPADELDDLVGAFNQMYARLQVAYGDLQERESKVRRLVDSNIIGTFIWKASGSRIEDGARIAEANDAFLNMVGYNRADIAAGRISRAGLTAREWMERDAQGIVEIRETGTVAPFEKELLRKDGSRLPVLIGYAAFDSQGREGVAFVVDLTERKRAEAEAREVRTELEHANRIAAIGQLSASIGHEINQPLSGILTNAGTASLWLEANPPNIPDALRAIGRIERDGRRASEISARIRALVKKAPPQKDALDVNEAVGEIVGLIRGEATKSRVSIETQLDDVLPFIRGDRVQLQQVLLNLIMNAIEAMGTHDGGPRELLISTAKDGSDGIAIAVQDTGPGLSAADTERIFQAFFTTKATGLGIGLSICRSIIDAHGGKLWATANTPHGAVFQFTLPSGGESQNEP